MSNNGIHPNTRSVGRRMSFSPSTSAMPRSLGLSPVSSSSNSDAAKKDRRALLEEWRKQVRSKTNNNLPASLEVESESKAHSFESLLPKPPVNYGGKRFRGDEENVPPPYHHHVPPNLPRPPSAGSNTEGLSAVERYRLRKQMEHQQEKKNDDKASYASRSNSCADTEENEVLYSSRLLSTPSSLSRRLTISSSSKKARRQSTSILPLQSQSSCRSIQSPSPSRLGKKIYIFLVNFPSL
jgi:hypothetical protein